MSSEVLELSDEERATLFRAKREQEEQAQRESRAQATQLEGQGQQEPTQREDQIVQQYLDQLEGQQQEQDRGQIVALDGSEAAALACPNDAIDASLLSELPTAVSTAGALDVGMPVTLEAQQGTGLGLVQVARIDTPA